MLRSLIPLLLSNMFLAFTSIGQELDKIPVIFKNKNWSVRAWVDPMTDKKLCTGFYKDHSMSNSMMPIYMLTCGAAVGFPVWYFDSMMSLRGR